MSHFHFRIVNVSMLLIASFFFMSNENTTNRTVPNAVEDGKYVITVSGDVEMELIGDAVFKTKVQKNSKKVSFSTLDLMFKNSENPNLSALGFYIAQQNRTKKITEGSYAISAQAKSFLRDFNGAFGFVSHQKLGNEPFYTEKGKVEIYNVEENSIRGVIKATLKTNKGKIIYISGEFSGVAK